MIDFRYHLVSLISVFLALAVGIVLGAGPLRESLGDQLAGQVEQLRTEKETLRTANSTLTARSDQMGSYVTETAPRLVAGTLPNVRVAIVSDDESARSSADALATLVTDAEGSVPVRITLDARLWDPAHAQERADALAALRAAAPELQIDGGDDTARLASGISRLLTAPASELPGGRRSAGLKVLTTAQIITVDGELVGPVDAIILAAAAPSELLVAEDAPEAAAARAQALASAQGGLLEPLVTKEVPTVVAGPTPGGDDAVSALRLVRGDARLHAISTIDGLERPDGPVVAVMALAEQVDGGQGDYGTGSGVRARMPAISAHAGGSSSGTSDGGGRG